MQAALRRAGRGETVRLLVAGPAAARKLATRLLDVLIGVRGWRTAEPGDETLVKLRPQGEEDKAMDMGKNVMPPRTVDADRVARKIASDPNMDGLAIVAHKLVEDEIKSTPTIMDERRRIASIASSMTRVVAGVLYAPTVCAPQGVGFLDAALADQAVLCLHKLFLDDRKNKKGRALLGSKKLKRSTYDPMFHPFVQPESARHRPFTGSFGGGELVLPVAYANLRGVSLRDDVASIETARMFDYERGATIDAGGLKAQVLCHIRKRGMPQRWQEMMAALRTQGIALNDCVAAMLRTLPNLGDGE